MKHIRLIVFIAFSLFISSCELIKPIEFKGLENISVSTDNNFKIEADLLLYNPNAMNIKVSSLDLDVLIEEVSLGKVNIPNGLELVKKGITTTKVSVTMSIAKLMFSAPQLLPIIKKGGFNLIVKGTLYPEAAFLPATMRINHKVKVEL